MSSSYIYLMQHVQLFGLRGTVRIKDEDDAVGIPLDGRPTALVLRGTARVLRLKLQSLES
jgi:hypothetical protein